MKKTKRLLSAMLAAVMAVSLTACGGNSEQKAQQEAEQAALSLELQELRQGDYRGGVKRTLAFKDSIIEVMENMKSNNITIRQTSPNSFWTADGYQDFVSTLLDIDIIEDTQWFNEEETDWAAILQQYVTVAPFGSGEKLTSTITRNEKDDYSISGVAASLTAKGEAVLDGELYEYNAVMSNDISYRILYDCDKDWCKAYATMPIKELKKDNYKDVTVKLYEYQRVDDNTFAIQTSRERLLVVLNPAETDTPVCDRTIKEFYYSKLVQDGCRTTYTPDELLPETDLLTGEVLDDNIDYNQQVKDYLWLNREGDLAFWYGQNDSMFFRMPTDMTPEWVFEDKSLQQAICYKDGVLVVTTYNKLSTNYERFVYALASADEKIAGELEKLVEINNLVGLFDESALVEEKLETEDVEPSTGTTENSTSEADVYENTTPTDAVNNETAEEVTEGVTEEVVEETASEIEIPEPAVAE